MYVYIYLSLCQYCMSMSVLNEALTIQHIVTVGFMDLCLYNLAISNTNFSEARHSATGSLKNTGE